MTIADESAKAAHAAVGLASEAPASEAPVTRLWIFSDLHLELAHWELPAIRPECDVIVAAGDIHSPASQTIRWLAEHADGVPVITVPGNHEWYAPNRTFNVEDERRRAADLAANLGVHLLMDAEAIVHGVRFLGTTLWTDYALHDDVRHGMKVAERAMNDHRCIYPTPGMTLLRAEDARQWHHRARSWLAERLAEPSPHPTVVVTHHLPHPPIHRSPVRRRSAERRLLLRPLRPRRRVGRSLVGARPYTHQLRLPGGRHESGVQPEGLRTHRAEPAYREFRVRPGARDRRVERRRTSARCPPPGPPTGPVGDRPVRRRRNPSTDHDQAGVCRP